MGKPNNLAIFACVCVMIVGCGKGAEPAKPVEPPRPPATEPARPTTQELLSGKTKPLPLPGTPLILTVPESWKIDATGPITFLVGPSLGGTVTIGLSAAGGITFKQQEIDALVAKLADESATHLEQFRRETHRNIGNVQVIERRFLRKSITRNKNDARGEPLPDDHGGFQTVTATPVQWTITAFSPGDKDFVRYELNVIELEADQLAIDEPLLNKVMDSLTIPGVAPATAATTRP